MDQLEESTRLIIDEYRRRFGDLPDLPAVELDVEVRSRFVAALERALSRNMPLSITSCGSSRSRAGAGSGFG